MVIYIALKASFSVKKAPKSLAAGAPPQTPLGELAALPRPPIAVMGLDRNSMSPLIQSSLPINAGEKAWNLGRNTW